jgi:hypothetical protein
MANINPINAFISINDIINNFIISYTGPGKLIPDSKRTEVVFHARRCLQEFAYETLKSQFTKTLATPPIPFYKLPDDFVTIIEVICNDVTFSQVEYEGPLTNPTFTPGDGNYAIEYTTNRLWFDPINNADPGCNITYLSNALTTDENAAIPKLAEEALYACMVYAILANRTNTDPNLLQRLLIEKIDKLERSKSRLVFTNFSE